MRPRKEAVKGRKCWKFPDKIAANVAVTGNLFLSPLAANKSDVMCNNYGQHGVLTFTLHRATSDDIKAALIHLLFKEIVPCHILKDWI